MILENKKGSKVEKCCPYYRLEGGKYLGGNDCCNRVGCVVKTIDVVEDQSQYDNNNNKSHCDDLIS